MRTIVLAVGRLRPPYADDVQHYQKLLARHTRLELVELRDEDAGRRPHSGARLRLPARLGRQDVRLDRLQPLPGGAPAVGPGPLLRGRRAARTRSRPVRPAPFVRPDDASAPARARGAAGAGLPRAQDPRAASHTITDVTTEDAGRQPQGSRRATAAAELPAGTARLKAHRASTARQSAEFGDYSTNAALLLAPAARRAAARRGRAPGRPAGASASAACVERVEVAGPGFLNLFMSDAWFRDALDRVARGRATDSARGQAEPPRARARGVRDARTPPARCTVGHAPPRRLRRLARAHPRVRRPQRGARVLRQRLRHPGAAVRRVDPAPARAARSRPRTATTASYVAELAAAHRRRRRRRRGRAGRRAGSS